MKVNQVVNAFDPEKNFSLVKVTIPTCGEYAFSVSQIALRLFKRTELYQYSFCRLILMKLKNDVDLEGGVEYINEATTRVTRDTYIEVKDLKAGNYYFFVEMLWNPYTEDRIFSVTCYGTQCAIFQSDDYQKYSKTAILEKALISKAL